MRLQNHIAIFWVLLFFLNLFLRAATFYTPVFDVDETQFAGFAHVLLDGGLPYLNSLDTKPLGIYLFYAVVFFLFGKTNMIAVHFVTALLLFLASIFLAKTFSLWGRARTGRLAALLFIVFSTTFVPKYVATSINSVMVLFLVLSVYFFSRATRKAIQFDDFLAGLFLGIAFLFKYTAGIQLVLFFLYVMILGIRKSSFVQAIGRNVFFGVGFIVPIVLHSMILFHLGVWQDFYEWSILGSGSYIAHGSATISFFKSFVVRFGGFVLATIFLWLHLIRDIKKTSFQSSLYLLFFLWFLLTLIPVCMGGRFYPHYFIPLLPSLCGLAALSVGRKQTEDCLDKPNKLTLYFLPRISRSVLIGLVIFPALFFWVLRLDYQLFLKHFPDDAIYEQAKIGKQIKSISEPDDSLFVWGFATGIYFYSELKPVSRFLWADLLTGRTPGPYYARLHQEQENSYANPKAWRAFWEDIKPHPPTFFVDTSPANIHDYGRFPIQKHASLQHYLNENYVKVAIVEGVDVYKLRN